MSATISREAVLAELARELRVRRDVFPRWVESKKITQEQADQRMLRMTEEQLKALETKTLSQAMRQLVFNVQPSKYRNEKTRGYASKKEAERAKELRLLEKAGVIRNLREQVSYELIPAQPPYEKACAYVADFVYDEFIEWRDGWREIAEDCKGYRTEAYRIKRKLMLSVHGIRIRET
jgi:hypothetical protein